MKKEVGSQSIRSVVESDHQAVQDWVATTAGRRAMNDALEKGQRMALRLNAAMQLDPKKLEEPFTR